MIRSLRFLIIFGDIIINLKLFIIKQKAVQFYIKFKRINIIKGLSEEPLFFKALNPKNWIIKIFIFFSIGSHPSTKKIRKLVDIKKRFFNLKFNVLYSYKIDKLNKIRKL